MILLYWSYSGPIKTYFMENINISKKQSEMLIFCGFLLFFLGLVVGLLIPLMSNPRMGLSAHLEGVINGIFLMVIGMIWVKLELKEKWLKITFYLTLYGSFANFIAVSYAAITGAGKMMPLSGGTNGTLMSEIIISFLLVTLAIAMLSVCILVMLGLYNKLKSN